MLSKALLPFFMLLVLASLLAGCLVSDGPSLIAAYPSGGVLPQPPPSAYLLPQAFVYNARLALEAWRPNHTADTAVELAARYGGYLVSSHTWRQDGDERLSVTLAVPVYNFGALYDELRGLGKVVSEQVWGEWKAYYPDGAPTYSQITIEISPRALDLRAIFPEGWNPAHTFSSALRFSVVVFRTLLDTAIWLLVLVAPIALLVLGVRYVIKRIRS